MQIFARFFVTLGIVLLAIGLLFYLLPGLGLHRLPGDIVIKNKHWVFVFPVVTSIIVSLVLTLILNLLLKK